MPTEAPRDLFDDVKAVGHVIGFCFRAVRRRRRLAVTTTALAWVLLAAGLVSLPKRFEAGFRIQTDRGAIIAGLVNVQGATAQNAESATRGVAELLRSRQYLNSLVSAVHLLETWDQDRPLPARIKDRLRELVSGPLPEDELRAALRKMLSERMHIEVDASGVIGVVVNWTAAPMAKQIADAALRVFLEMRRDNELNQIRDTKAILQERVARSQARLNDAADRLETLLHEKEGVVQQRLGTSLASKPKTRMLSFRRAVKTLPDEARDVARSLEDTTSRLERLEHGYQADLARANERLEALRQTLGPEHPDLRQAERDLEKFGVPPPELEAARTEETGLRAKLSGYQEGGEDRSGRFSVVQMPVTGDVYAALITDPDVDNLMTEVSKNVQDHNQLLDRLDNAEVALVTSRAAFTYRYIVTEPPTMPSGAKFPTPGLAIGASLAVALLLGFLSAVLADVATRRVLEAWQLEALLGVRVLGRARSE